MVEGNNVDLTESWPCHQRGPLHAGIKSARRGHTSITSMEQLETASTACAA